MDKYNPDALHEIVENVNLVDYIGDQIDLEYKSGNYFGHCPKHVDNTPSFSVNPQKNLYYCFSCGRGGNIINYLMQYEGLDRDHAIEKAARLANVDIESFCKNQTLIINKAIKNKQKQGINCTHEVLPWSLYQNFSKEPIQEWIQEGIPQSIMDVFDVRIDHASNRIVYPVTDISGNFINIKGRTRFPDYKALKIPKYINYYPVGCLDYFQGYVQAAPAINESKSIIIFESLKSVMKLRHYGMPNSVSAETHYLRKEQVILLIKNNIKDVTLAWDSDVDYKSQEVKKNIDLLKRFMNVNIVVEKNHILGGVDGKNSPVDCGFEIWEYLYKNRLKVI